MRPIIFSLVKLENKVALKELDGQAIFQRNFPNKNRKNIKSPPDLSVEQGQMGNGSSSLSLSRTDIRRSPLGGCRLPDAILHGKRSFRPRSRAVQRLRSEERRVGKECRSRW